MVRAILEGRKTQTRRIFKPQPAWHDISATKRYFFLDSKYGNVGDHLWVRETFQWVDMGDDSGYVYRATDPDWETTEGWTWKPSIFMPRAASRITLEITNIRYEELIEISENDAIAEGVEQWPDGNYKHYGKTPGKYTFARFSYQSLWDQINGEGAWAQNPFVWVIEFKRV
jgi:hypothetical protein